MAALTITSELQTKTCSCGLIYAVPSWLYPYECPACAGEKIALGQERINRLEKLWTINKRLRTLLKNKNKKGLTLIEFIVALFLIVTAVMTGIFFIQECYSERPKAFQAWCKQTGNPKSLTYDEWCALVKATKNGNTTIFISNS